MIASRRSFSCTLRVYMFQQENLLVTSFCFHHPWFRIRNKMKIAQFQWIKWRAVAHAHNILLVDTVYQRFLPMTFPSLFCWKIPPSLPIFHLYVDFENSNGRMMYMWMCMYAKTTNKRKYLNHVYIYCCRQFVVIVLNAFHTDANS